MTLQPDAGTSRHDTTPAGLDPNHCPACGGGEWEFLRGEMNPVRIHCLGCNSVFTLGGQLVPGIVPAADVTLTPEQVAEFSDRLLASATGRDAGGEQDA